METALFNNRTVTVVSFQRLRTSPQDRATCPACGEKVFLSGARSTRKAASFNHMPGSEEKTPCVLSYKEHPNYSGLRDVDLEEVQLRAEALKSNFYRLENLKRAFTFLTKVAGKGAVNRDVFVLLLQKADKLDVWRYAGLPVWAVPYILLTLSDFYIQRESKPTYVVRFVIDKPSRSKLNTTWLQPEQCALVKYFVNKGKATKVFGAKPAVTGLSSGPSRVKNPLPFSEAEFNALTGDTSWISSGLDNLLAEIAVDAVVEVDDDMPGHQAPPSGSVVAANAARSARASTTGAAAGEDAGRTESSMLRANPVFPAVTAAARPGAGTVDSRDVAAITPLPVAHKQSESHVDRWVATQGLPDDASTASAALGERSELSTHLSLRQIDIMGSGSVPEQQNASNSAPPAKLNPRAEESRLPDTVLVPTVVSSASQGVGPDGAPSFKTPEGPNGKILPPGPTKPSIPNSSQATRKAGLWGWLKSLFR